MSWSTIRNRVYVVLDYHVANGDTENFDRSGQTIYGADPRRVALGLINTHERFNSNDDPQALADFVRDWQRDRRPG